MSDVSSEPSLWTHLVLLIQSGILPYSPNCLRVTSKLNSTHGLLTSSTLVGNVTLNGLLLSPLPVKPQGSVLGPVLFLIFTYDLSASLENPLYLFADDSIFCRDIHHLSDRQAAASSLSSDFDKIT